MKNLSSQKASTDWGIRLFEFGDSYIRVCNAVQSRKTTDDSDKYIASIFIVLLIDIQSGCDMIPRIIDRLSPNYTALYHRGCTVNLSQSPFLEPQILHHFNMPVKTVKNFVIDIVDTNIILKIYLPMKLYIHIQSHNYSFLTFYYQQGCHYLNMYI